jgi:hypothetical protein
MALHIGDELKALAMDMYIFAELDNLEYVIEKYRLGYMRPDQALRGVQAFRSRFQIKGFRDEIDRLSKEGLTSHAGYKPATDHVVNKILNTIPSSES